MSKNSSQSWVIILSVVVVALAIALMLSKKSKHQAGNDKSIEIAYQQAQQTATYAPTPTAVEPVPVAKPAEPLLTPATDSYGIQIISLSDEAKAQEVVNKLTATGLSGYLTKVDLGNQKTTYRAFVGPFASYTDSMNQLPAVKALYKDAFIFKN